MEYVDERYHGVFYSDKESYLGEMVRPAMTALLKGDPSSMILEINQEKYNDLCFYISSSTLNQVEMDLLIDTISSVITQTPSVTHLSVMADINSVQAANLTRHLADSNIYDFSIRSEHLSSEGMHEFINSLSHSKVRMLEVSGQLDDATIAEMRFKGTNIEMLTIRDLYASDNGFLQLFKNLYGSSVNDLYISHQDIIKAEVAKKIDLSQTNLQFIYFDDVSFEEQALANMKFSHSKISFVLIDNSGLTGNHLTELSYALQNSNVEELIIEVDEIAKGDLSKLQLTGTNVQYLSLWNANGLGGEVANLPLQNTPLKTLWLSGAKITDQDLTLLNFEDTVLEHLILDYNPITDVGKALLKDLIKDTSIIDVSLASVNLSEGEGMSNQYLLINEHVSPREYDIWGEVVKYTHKLLPSDIISENQQLFNENAQMSVPIIDESPLQSMLYKELPKLIIESSVDWA